MHDEYSGLDLLDFFSGKHSWEKLLRLLGQLPSTSRYTTAQRADDEYVARLAEAGVEFDAKGEMTEDGYGPVEARLDNITDAITALQHTLLAVNGGKPGRFQGVTRPTNAVERHKEKQRARRYASLVTEFEQARERRRQRQKLNA